MGSIKSKENNDTKENKQSKKSKEPKLKEKNKDKKSKGEKKDKERKSKSELKDPNEAKFLNEKIKLLEGQLKEKTNNFNNNNLDNSLINIDNFNISLKYPIYTLNYHKDSIFCLSILNDGRLISGSADNSIIIYNKTTFEPDLIINEHKGPVNCIIELSSGILVSCSRDNTIKLFNINGNNYNIIQTLNDHRSWVHKIIEIGNKYGYSISGRNCRSSGGSSTSLRKYIVSCSDDKSIIFYLKNNLKYKKDYQILTNDRCFYISQIKENEICYSENNDKICFYDIKDRKIKSSISNISKSAYSPFIMISKDLLFFSGYNKISIVNINYYELIREIEVPNSGWIYGACMLNKNILFTGDYEGIIREWKIKEDNLILISKNENSHNSHIYTLLNIGNGHIASGSLDFSIKIW